MSVTRDEQISYQNRRIERGVFMIDQEKIVAWIGQNTKMRPIHPAKLTGIQVIAIACVDVKDLMEAIKSGELS